MASDAMRAEFEKEVLRRYPNSNLARSQDGYAHTATHSAVPMTYASIQMLWEVWQAARRTPAAEVAGSSDSSMPVVAWCDLSNPLNNEAFAWPGTLSPASHTSALVLQSDALKAIEEARVEAEKLREELARTERNRDMLKEQCAQQARHLESLHMSMAANIRVAEHIQGVRAASSLDEGER